MDKNLHKHHNKMNIITKGLMKLFLVLLIAQAVFPTLVLAEGTVDFIDYPGYRLMMFAERQQQTKVFANEGEYINFGASHVGITGGFIRVFRPDGTLHSTYDNTGDSEGLAIINNDIEELNGPTGGGTNLGAGYVPGIVEVQPGEAGAWTITFEFPIYTNDVFDNLMNNEPWNRTQDQPLNQRCVLAWDISISQGGAGNNNGTLIDGRVYTNEYQSIVSLNGNLTSPTFYVITPDGFQYQVDYHDVDPWGFPIFSNNWGIVRGNVQPTYASWEDENITRSEDVSSWSANNTYIYEPQAEDTEMLVNNKIFFNLPNTDLPDSTLTTDIYRNNTHTTWLFSDPPLVDIDVDGIRFFSNETMDGGMPVFDAFSPVSGANISFTSTLSGTARIDLDLNFDGDFEDDIDLALYKRVAGGVPDSIYWDGTNGLGEQTFTPAQDVNVGFEISMYGGEMHVLMGDVENDLGGVVFTRINGLNAPVDTFYYNHRRIGGESSGGLMVGEPLPTTTPYTYSNNFGNRKTLDYWTYIGFKTGLGTFTIDVVDGIDDLVSDSDEDTIRDNDDLDDDNDGIPDKLEYCPGAMAFSCLPAGLDPSGDLDVDGIINFADADDPGFSNPCDDADGDGICDTIAAVFDFDGDGIPNHLDLDSDNDGITDIEEANHGQLDANGDGVIDGLVSDFIMNGLYNPLATDSDSFDAVANYIPSDVDQDGFPDFLDLDSDNDGIFDIKEAGHDLLTDADNNGMGDLSFTLTFSTRGLLPALNPNITGNPIPFPLNSDADEVEDYRDRDSDNDGITDVLEGGNLDSDNDGIVGAGLPTVNDFGVVVMDGSGDPVDYATTNVPDTDNDGIEDYLDLDSDNDGINDVVEGGNLDADDDGVIGTDNPIVDDFGMATNVGVTSNPLDSDEDGVQDYLDLDSDNDGINDVVEGGNLDADNDGIVGTGNPEVNEDGQPIGNNGLTASTSNPLDSDEDGVQDYLDLDSDNDGINDVVEGGNLDADNDGIVGTGNPEVNEDGQTVLDGDVVSTSNPLDSDEDGVQDYLDLDSDNDGINDVVEGGNLDADNDGIVGTGNPEVNEDGQPIGDNGLTASTSNPLDSDEDGVEDYVDLDSDNDGINDVVEGGNLDADNDGIVGTGTPTVNEAGQPLGNNGDVVSTSDPLDSDEDGVEDYLDLDSDNDGINDVIEGGNLDADNDGMVGTGDPEVNEDGQTLLGGDVVSTSNPLDSDEDGVQNYLDLDSDNDGINDVVEGGNLDADNDGIVGTGNPEVNEDGQPIGDNGLTASTSNPLDSDEDGVEDYVDLDSDNDGINDVVEGGNLDADNDGIVGTGTPTVNEVGQPLGDNGDVVSTSDPLDSDEDGVEDYLDLDSDNDGINDVVEGGADDPDNDGIVGEGTPIVNEAGQPLGNNGDVVSTSDPLDSDEDGIEDYLDLDSDNDGINDVVEGGNLDPDNDGIVGTGDPEVNEDGQPIGDDGLTASTSDPLDTDGDGVEDYLDLDSDNDGINDVVEGGADDPDNDGIVGEGTPTVNEAGQPLGNNGDVVSTSNPTDTDGNGDPDYTDLDSDDDGINDVIEGGADDPDNDGIVGEGDPEVNDDGQPTINGDVVSTSNPTDTDGNGDPDYTDLDSDDDGLIDADECNGGSPCLDFDEDGTPDFQDIDSDDDGINDDYECPNGFPCPDSDNDGNTDHHDLDSDDDGIQDEDECPNGAPCPDTDNDGDDDFVDVDSDDDGAPDEDECPGGVPCPDFDGDGDPDQLDPDCSILVDNALIAGSSTICEGADIELTIANSNAYFETYPNSEIQFIWSDNTIEYNTGNSPVLSLPANVGTTQQVFTVSVMVDGCISDVSPALLVDVVSIPEAVISPTATSICQGEEVTLSANSGAGLTYEWYLINTDGNTLVGNEEDLVLSDMSNNGTYELQVTANGCTEVSTALVAIEVNPIPMIELTSSTQSFCTNEDIVVTASSNNGLTGDVTYTWSGPNGAFTQTVDASQAFEWTVGAAVEANAGMYQLTLETANECISVTETLMVEIADALATPELNVSSAALCEGSDLMLSIENTSYSNVMYEWFYEGSSIAETEDPSYNILDVLVGGTGSYSVEVTSTNCGSVQSLAVPVEVFAVVEVPMIDNPTSLNAACEGTDVLLEVMNEQPEAIYRWFGPQGEMLPNQGFNAMYTLFDVQEGDEGLYYVEVEVENANEDCSTQTSETTMVEIAEPIETTVIAATNNEVCENGTVILELINNQDLVSMNTASFEWHYVDDNGSDTVVETTSIPILTLNNVTTANSGMYYLELTVGECTSSEFVSLNVSVSATPNITAEANIQNVPCDFDAISLVGNEPAIGTGQWLDINGDPIGIDGEGIVNIDNLQQEDYQYIWALSNEACVNYSMDTLSYSNTVPLAAYAGEDQSLCENSYSLSAVPALSTLISEWESPSGVIFEDSFDANTEVSNLQPGENVLVWTLSEPNCPDFSVDTIVITYYPTTDVAEAGLDYDDLCSSDQYQLNGTMPEFGFGEWTTTSGAMIGNVNQPNAMATNLQEGENVFIWQLSNENCENYSTDTVIVSYNPPVDEPVLVMDAQTYACFETTTGTLMLEAETPQLATGMWEQTIGPSVAIISNENAATTQVENLEAGVYVFTWTLTQGDCMELGSEAVMIDISVTPTDQALVMNDQMITCADTEVMIEADQPQTAEGFWMPLTEGLTISDEDNAVTQVSGLQVGENQIAWMLSYENCENYSTDVLTIFLQEGVNTTEDNFSVISGTSLSDVNILDNDTYNADGNWTIAIVDTPQNGQLNVSETGEITYVANESFIGTDFFTYELCNEDCDDCQEATVTIEVMPDPNVTCFVPNIITPNNDGFNDALVIPCTDQFSDNYIIIFNRWGDKVYEREQYQNDWRGEYNDIMLPAGTYFYIFKKDKNANDALQGYISIMR